MALATAPQDRGSTFPIWCGVKPAPDRRAVLPDQIIAEPAGPGGRSAPDACGGLQDPPRLRGRHRASATAGGAVDAWHCRDSVSFSPAAISLHHISRQGIPHRYFRVHGGAIFPFSRQSALSLSK